MKAEVVHQYGGPEVMKFETFPDPVAGPGQILIRVSATSINPVDWKQRDGSVQEMFPLNFPDILGKDVSGTVVALGKGAKGFAVGDRVIALATKTYAELVAVDVKGVAKIPDTLDLIDAAALPLVVTTGSQLVEATSIREGQTLLVTGAVGSVGRAAVYAAKQMGAKVIAAVRFEQFDQARDLDVDQIIATGDDGLEKIGRVDAVADTIGGEFAERAVKQIREGGVFATALQPPKNSPKTIRAVRVQSHADSSILTEFAEAMAKGTFDLPISERYQMKDARQAHVAAEKGGKNKILLVN